MNMINNLKKHLTQSAIYALMGAGFMVYLLCGAYFIAEPTISHGNATSTFYVRQTITDETSFLVAPTNVTMAGSIAGMTGGNATGTTDFVVKSNSSTGYYVQIAFEDNAGTEAMYGDVSTSEALRDYGPGGVSGITEPSYNFTASTAAQFAYTVSSLTNTDTDYSFWNNSTNACNVSTQFNASRCWKSPDTAPFRIIDRDTSALTGATSTLTFKVNVPNNPVPALVEDTYTATATLSVYAQ